MSNFNEQNIIITGGTKGIGKGIAKAFLKASASVILTYSSDDNAAEQFLIENSEYRSKIDLQKFDVTDTSAVSNFFKYIDEKYKSIEVLVNNCGIRQDSVLALMTNEQWAKVLDINLNGTFYMCKEIIPRFMSNRYGRIINISSIGGQLGLSGQANYAASKAGQIALSKSLSKEVAKKKITVNCVCPGFIETDLISDLPEEQVKEYKKIVPMKRFGKVEEVASGVLFLASREASYITGSTLEITGGL